MNSFEKVVKCELCGGHTFKNEMTKNMIDIVRCCDCSLMFANIRVWEDEETFSKEFYGDAYFTGSSRKTEWGEFGYKSNYFSEIRVEKTRIALSNLLKIEKKVGCVGRVLDVGCAAGYFLKVAKDRGWETWGVEISDMAAQYASEQFGLDVKVGTLETVDIPINFFDVITGWDIIEHVRHPCVFIRRASQLLRNNGLFVLGTPNSGSLATRIKKEDWRHFNPPEHLFYFDPGSFAKLFGEYFSEVTVQPCKSPYSKIDFSIKNIVKRAAFIGFNNFSSLIHQGEYLKAYAWK